MGVAFLGMRRSNTGKMPQFKLVVVTASVRPSIVQVPP